MVFPHPVRRCYDALAEQFDLSSKLAKLEASSVALAWVNFQAASHALQEARRKRASKRERPRVHAPSSASLAARGSPTRATRWRSTSSARWQETALASRRVLMICSRRSAKSAHREHRPRIGGFTRGAAAEYILADLGMAHLGPDTQPRPRR